MNFECIYPKRKAATDSPKYMKAQLYVISRKNWRLISVYNIIIIEIFYQYNTWFAYKFPIGFL